jgi:hypothetical protein
MDYIHTWLNKWRMQGNFTKSKVMVFHPKEGESCSVIPAKDRRNAWTLGGIAIDQVSKYKYLGVVYQEMGSWQARAKALAKMQAAYGYWRPLLSCSSLPTRSDCSWFRPSSIPAVMYGAEVWDTTKAVKDKMSAVVKNSRSILALHPETALLTFCTGTLGYFTRCTH